ncbi:MAG: hypothetical protein NTZ83_04275 [Candidatus Pacearchaeota archaeon]|nr:hypothetical protein [Candidatus Pacearchaeota archaeon]
MEIEYDRSEVNGEFSEYLFGIADNCRELDFETAENNFQDLEMMLKIKGVEKSLKDKLELDTIKRIMGELKPYSKKEDKYAACLRELNQAIEQAQDIFLKSYPKKSA